MKKPLFKITRSFAALFSSVALIGGMASCTFDDTDLQNSIDDLTSRVEALEDFQEQVQGDIASLQDIISKLDSSVTVNNVVDNGDGSWTINFSDGTSITIRNGQDGEDGLTPPSITVVEEDGTYYWAYENADGTTDFILDDDGNKIPVSGEAPQVRINEDGYWEISSDGGKTWENTKVKAEGGSGESIFSDVTVKDGYMYLTLADGTEIRIPLTAELAFDFGTGESVLYFAAGESKTLDYTMSGAETYTITKPDGWRASIEGEGLVITAPVEENVYAETEGVVSVILFASNGQSFMAEQNVAIGAAFAGGDGSIDNPYIITSAEGMLLMAEKINLAEEGYISAHYALGADIDMAGVEYTPAKASYSAPFKGSFDGKGFKIENLNINLPDAEYVALFGITDGASFRNITIASGEITGGRYTSAIASRVNGSGTVENCTNHANITGTKNSTAGLVAQLYGMSSMKDCNNYGTVTGLNEVGGLTSYVTASNMEGCGNYGHVKATTSGIGGIFYNGNGNGTVSDCVNYGIAESRTSVGGICSVIGSGFTVKECINEGEIIVSLNGAGGIAGGISMGGTIDGCQNKGRITGKPDGGTAINSAGGIVGTASENSIITNCVNQEGATFTGISSAVGGIVGTARKATIEHCENFATMQQDNVSDVGGIVGNCNANLNFCTNHADISAGQNTGGIIGYNGDLSKIRMCENKGKIAGTDFVGGIAGVTYSTISACANRSEINGMTYVGGIVGAVSGPYSYVLADYNTGNVTASSIAGGITGGIENDGLVVASYSVADIAADEYFGGACGMIDEYSAMTSCFYAGFDGPAFGSGNGECLYFSDGTAAPEGAETGWPSSTAENWGINTPGNDGQNGLWWKDLGTEGSQDYPALWWE